MFGTTAQEELQQEEFREEPQQTQEVSHQDDSLDIFGQKKANPVRSGIDVADHQTKSEVRRHKDNKESPVDEFL